MNAYGQGSLENTSESRLILAQKNVDVDALNQGVRDLLRAQGKLGETEIICSTQRGRVAFAEGDRVHLTQTNKEQGLIKGCFGAIEHIDLKTKKLTVRLDNNEIKQINPNTYDGLRHGYASTVYRAQGATIDHVYVLHTKTTNQSTNYVALTRQAKSLHLYVSGEETPSHTSLIHQMGRHDGNRTSLVFDTLQDMEKRQEEKSFVSQIKQKAETILNKIKDVFHKNKEFYQFKPLATVSQEKAEIVVHKPQRQMKGERDQTEESRFQKKLAPEISPSKSREVGDDFNDVLKKQDPQGVRDRIQKELLDKNVLEGSLLDKGCAKPLHAERTPATAKELSIEKRAIMARIAREQKLQGYGSSAGAPFSSPSFSLKKAVNSL